MHFSYPFRGCQNEGRPLANDHPEGSSSKRRIWGFYRVSQKKSLIKFFLDDFPTDLDYGPTANFVAGHLVACQRSACYFFEGMTRSSRMLHSSAESWAVVHVRWEVVKEKFYQRLFSGTPCSWMKIAFFLCKICFRTHMFIIWGRKISVFFYDSPRLCYLDVFNYVLKKTDTMHSDVFDDNCSLFVFSI